MSGIVCERLKRPWEVSRKRQGAIHEQSEQRQWWGIAGPSAYDRSGIERLEQADAPGRFVDEHVSSR